MTSAKEIAREYVATLISNRLLDPSMYEVIDFAEAYDPEMEARTTDIYVSVIEILQEIRNAYGD